MRNLTLFTLLALLYTHIAADCAFKVDNELKPYTPVGDDVKPQLIEMSTCSQQWNGQMGCCNSNSYAQTVKSFQKIDTVFGSLSGGCDLCAINLKRFWCMYSCSPNQADFVETGEWIDVPSFDHPGKMEHVQSVTITVEDSTACRLFDSCKRTAYASQLSAMSSPAGFLNFQGNNAIEDGVQFITMKFSKDKTKSLYLPEMDLCNVTLPSPVGDEPAKYREFEVAGNCTCNNCESRCAGIDYFKETPVMEGFNYALVGSVWGAVIVSTIAITVFRAYKNKHRKEQ